jgi:hypothetical protein
MELKVNLNFFLSIFESLEKKLCIQTINKPKGIDYTIYKDEYSHNAMDLLKEKEIVVNDKTDFIYLHCSSLTNFDIFQRMFEFYDNFKIINVLLKDFTQNLEDFLYFETKAEFEKFFKEFIPDKIFMNRYFLKVNEYNFSF